MTISSVGSYGPATQGVSTSNVQRQPEAAEVKSAGGDRDGDADDSGAKAVQAPKPTVNANGQTIGQIVNTTA